MEAPDVRDGEYRLFDCEGLEYRVRADTDDSEVTINGPLSSDPQTAFVLDAATRFLEGLAAPQGSHGAVDGSTLCERLEQHAK
jgi:RNase P/RNase MRP subunit p29